MAPHGNEKVETMTNIVSYDAQQDILSIHQGFSADEAFKGNLDSGDIILDVSTRGRIRGIEIMHATSFFKEFNEGAILTEITHAAFIASHNPHGILLTIQLRLKNQNDEIAAKIAVPLEVPLHH